MEGWTQLYNELRKDSRTAYFPRWSSDMRWGFEQTALDLPASPSLAPVTSAPSDAAAHFAGALLQPELDVQMKASLSEKQANAKRMADDRTFAQAHPASKDADEAPAAPWSAIRGSRLEFSKAPAGWRIAGKGISSTTGKTA